MAFKVHGQPVSPDFEFEWSLDGSGRPDFAVRTKCSDATPVQLAAGGVTFEADPAPPPPPPDRLRVRKSVIVKRLNDAGKLQQASTALNADLFARERWYAPDQPTVFADDPEVLALLKAIGAQVSDILAPEVA